MKIFVLLMLIGAIFAYSRRPEPQVASAAARSRATSEGPTANPAAAGA